MKRLAAPLLAAFVAFVGTFSVPAAYADEPRVDVDESTSNLDAFTSNQRVSGVMRANYFRSSKTFDADTDFLGATVQIKALPSLGKDLDGKLELRLTHPDLGGSAKTRGRLLEGYVTIHFESADLRIGKQIVAWGRADGINPTDNLTPRDYAVMLPFEDDQRFGTVAVKLDASLSRDHTLTVFASPFFAPSKIPLPAVGPTVVEKAPARTLSNTEVGLKLNAVGEGLDWSVSYFRGFSLLPGMRLVSDGPARPALELHYDRITALGADFARNYGRFGLRGEVVYINTADRRGIDPSVKNPYLYWIAGVDRTFLDNLNVNLQFFQRRIRRYHDPEAIADPVARGIAIKGAIVGGQQDRLSNGISFRVSNKWLNDTLEAEIFSAVNFTRDNSFTRLLLSYAFSDHWKGTVGADVYRGPTDTQFGSLKANRGAFAELRYGF